MTDQDGQVLFFGVFAIGGALLLGKLLNGPRTILPSELVNPGAVPNSALLIPRRNEDDFILQSWKWVNDRVRYSDYGSHLEFDPDKVKGTKVLLPQQTLKAGRANCVGSAALLTSILRSGLPPDRVYMAVGTLNHEGVGGHAWTVVKKQTGDWYVLESTAKPPPQPWLRATDAEQMYVPEVLANDQGLICYSDGYCPGPGERKTVDVRPHTALMAARCFCEMTGGLPWAR